MTRPSLFVPAGSLAQAEVLINDSRLERIWEKLMKKHLVDYDLQIVTYIQPESDVTDEPYAMFRVVSPHPKPVFPDQRLEVLASMPLREWNDAEKVRWRYVGVPDPAEAILDGLVAEHVYAWTNLKQLI